MQQSPTFSVHKMALAVTLLRDSPMATGRTSPLILGRPMRREAVSSLIAHGGIVPLAIKEQT